MFEIAREEFVYNKFHTLEPKNGYYTSDAIVKFFNNKWLPELHFESDDSIIITLSSRVREDVKLEEFSMELFGKKMEYKGLLIMTPYNKFGFRFNHLPSDRKKHVVKINMAGLRRTNYDYKKYVNNLYKPSNGTITILNDNNISIIQDSYIDYRNSVGEFADPGYNLVEKLTANNISWKMRVIQKKYPFIEKF